MEVANERPKILFVDHETRLSGGEQDLLDLAAALASYPYDLHAALPGEGPLSEALSASGVTIHIVQMSPRLIATSRWELGKRPFSAMRQAFAAAAVVRRLMRLIDKLEPAVVHTNSMKSHLLAALPATSRGIPLIWHVRDILPMGWLSRLFNLVGGRAPALILCISRATASQFTRPAARARSRVIYNGIETSRFRDAVSGGWREKLGASQEQLLVGIVGQIAHWKGQDVFVEAAAKVVEEVPEARFAVVGECLFEQNEGDFDLRIRARATELGLDGPLVWAGWSDDPPAVMASLDVLVHASRLPEPFGRVIVEGMAAGAAVIASTEGAGPEIVGPDEGRLVEPDSAEALAEALIELLSEEALRSRLSAAAQAGAERFDIAHTAGSVASIYQELLG